MSSTVTPVSLWLLKYDYVPDILEKRGPHRAEHIAGLITAAKEKTLVLGTCGWVGGWVGGWMGGWVCWLLIMLAHVFLSLLSDAHAQGVPWPTRWTRACWFLPTRQWRSTSRPRYVSFPPPPPPPLIHGPGLLTHPPYPTHFHS